MKKFLPAILFTVFAFSMIIVIMGFNPIGDPHLPGYADFVSSPISKHQVVKQADSIALHYNRHACSDTGAMDIIAAIIFDYRGYDTLFETTVLFTALIGVLSIIGVKES
ncbi:MAG: hypothetical protein K6U11_02415 [bacterium]|nr:hypothetical protein [bacterium]